MDQEIAESLIIQKVAELLYRFSLREMYHIVYFPDEEQDNE